MSIKLSDKVYRNTQEQVLKNAEDIEELKAGTILIPDGAVTAPKIAGNAVTTDKLALNAVSTEKIQDEAVTSAKIAPGAVNTSKIENGSITNEKLVDDSVTESKIADGAVSYQKLDGDLKQEVNFGISERLKTINLVDFNSPLNNGLSLENCVEGETYTFNTNATFVELKIATNWDGVEVVTTNTAPFTFTMTSAMVGKSLFVIYGGSNITMNSNANYMLNEGSTALPYQPYAGPIIHAVDIEPVLLWENATPNVAFADQAITIKDNSKYKYIVVEFKITNGSDKLPIFTKNKKIVGRGNLCVISEGYLYSRDYYITSNTTIDIFKGHLGLTENNSCCIPIAIYGTNIL